MAKVTISEVEPLQPECLFTDPFKFKIRFNCIEDLQDDLDWKIIYVGSANSNQHDQGNYFIPESSSVIYQIFCLNGNKLLAITLDFRTGWTFNWTNSNWNSWICIGSTRTEPGLDTDGWSGRSYSYTHNLLVQRTRIRSHRKVFTKMTLETSWCRTHSKHMKAIISITNTIPKKWEKILQKPLKSIR